MKVRPTISLDGRLKIQYRPDPAFVYQINMPGVFTGAILNKEHIGKTGDELVVEWNEDYSEGSGRLAGLRTEAREALTRHRSSVPQQGALQKTDNLMNSP
jgi:hypothetical protein